MDICSTCRPAARLPAGAEILASPAMVGASASPALASGLPAQPCIMVPVDRAGRETPAGRAARDARLFRAAGTVCGVADAGHDLAARRQAQACRAMALQDARRQRAQIRPARAVIEARDF